MKITIIYDNTAHRENLRAGGGFSALVEAEGRTILFDTGAEGAILLENMSALGPYHVCQEGPIFSYDKVKGML